MSGAPSQTHNARYGRLKHVQHFWPEVWFRSIEEDLGALVNDDKREVVDRRDVGAVHSSQVVSDCLVDCRRIGFIVAPSVWECSKDGVCLFISLDVPASWRGNKGSLSSSIHIQSWSTMSTLGTASGGFLIRVSR